MSSFSGIRTAELFSIAKTGVNASTRLLNTTSNNIANINTEGYVRERTSFGSQLNGGVDRGYTERIISTFAQNQLRRDSTAVGEHQAFYDAASSLDDILASEANSISTSMTRFFSSIQTAADNPTNMPSRDSVLGDARGLVGRMNSLADFMKGKERELDLQVQNTVSRANGLIQQIGDLNKSINVLEGTSAVDTPAKLHNDREKAVLELSELIGVEVRGSTNNDSGIVVNLKSGESLVLADGAFNLFELGGEPDYTDKNLVLETNFLGDKRNTKLNIQEQQVGGTIGGLFRYREQVLEPSQRELGRLSVALADTLNQHNRQGMDLDLQLGSNIFDIPEFRGINYPDNANLGLAARGRFTPGEGGNVSTSDYKITVLTTPDPATSNFDIEVTALKNDGSVELDENGNAITQVVSINGQSGVFHEIMGGVEIELASGNAYSIGDSFLFKPTQDAAVNLTVGMGRPEDLAFAKPLRVDSNTNNLGDAALIRTHISNSAIDNTFTDPNTSAFNGNGGIHSAADTPAGAPGAPVKVVFSSEFDYQVLDDVGNVITSVTGASDLNNLLANAKINGSTPPWPSAFAALNDYPGYDFSLEGRPKAGDEFSLSYNTDGVSDNRNAVEMAELQQQGLVKQSIGSRGNKATFNEAYAGLVGRVGGHAANGDVSLAAAKVMKEQSEDWNESVSGVSLDEEAANLIQFQQSYAAAARILTTAQSLFDTILAVTR